MDTKLPITAPTKPMSRRKPLFRALEQRIMLDAAAVDTAFNVGMAATEASSSTNDLDDRSILGSLVSFAAPVDREKTKVLVVDQSVTDYQSLIDQAPDDFAVILVAAGESGLDSLVDQLAGFENIEALHILSHGDEGVFQLGSDKLTVASVDGYESALAELGSFMAADGDILLYGCDLAANADGEALLASLAELTQADIAASDDLTGASALGGDWELEASAGEVEAEELTLDYDHVLAGATYVTTEAAGELDTVHDVTDSIEFNIDVTGALPQESATLTIYAYDIDEEQGEVDEVYLNGVLIGTLKGVDSQWSTTTFEITDLSLIQQGENQIEIKIDAENTDPTNPIWEAQVDWGQILIDGGSQENGSFEITEFSQSVVSVDTATVSSTATVNITTSGSYKLEAVLSDQATGNIADIVEIEFNASAGQTLSFDIDTQYNITGPDGVCVMTFNLFAYDADNTPVLQEQSDYTFDTIQNVGPSVAPTSEDTSVTFFGADGYTFQTSDFPYSDADGGTMASVSIVTTPSEGTLSYNGTAITTVMSISVADIESGLLTYQPNSGETGDSYSQFNFRVNDGVKESESDQTLTLNVEETVYIQISTNDFYQSAGQDEAGATLSPHNVVDGTTYSYSLVSGEGGSNNGLFTVQGDQLHVVDSTTMAAGEYTIRVQITATGTANYTEQQVITINLIDDYAPVWNGDSDSTGDFSQGDNVFHATIAEGIAPGTDIGITASAEDGSGVTYTIDPAYESSPFVIDSQTGVISIAADGVINYETQSEYDILVFADDSNGHQSHYNFTVRVTNETPTLVGDVESIDRNVASINGNIFDNDSDAGTDNAADDLTVVSVNGSSATGDVQVAGTNGGVFSISLDGTWRFEANGEFDDLTDGQSRTTTVEIGAQDGGGEGDTSTLEITVQGSSNSQTLSITNNTVNQSSNDNTTVGVISIDTPESGISYEYSLVSGDGDTYNDGFTLNSDGTLTINDASALPAGDLSIRVLADRTSSRETSGELVYYSIVQTFTITLVDDVAPEIIGDSDSTADDGVVSGRASDGMSNGNNVGITAAVSDGETGDITFTLSDNAGGRFQIDADTGVVTVLDGSLLNSAVNSSHTITVVAADEAGNQDSYNFTISVIEAVEPAAVDDTADTLQDRSTSGNVLNNDNDPEGNDNELVVVAVGGSEAGVGNAVAGSTGGYFTIDANGRWTFQPNDEFDRLAKDVYEDTTVEVTVRDSLGLTSVSLLTVTVRGANDSPTELLLSETTYNYSQGDLIVGDLTANDPDEGDTHTITINRDNTRSFEVVDNQLRIQEGAELASGTYSIQFLVTDSHGQRMWETFEITVVDDQAPQFVDDGDSDDAGDSDGANGDVTTTAQQGDEVGITVIATDNSDVTYSLEDSAGGRFVIDSDTGVITVASGANFDVNTASFHDVVVRVTDEESNTDTQTFRITVTDEAPITVDDTASTTEHSTAEVSGNVLDNDDNPGEDNSLLTVAEVEGESSNIDTSVAGSNGGTFIVSADGSWVFDKSSDFTDMAVGEEITTTITVTVSDSTGITTESLLSVTVTGENDAPTQVELAGNTVALDSETGEVGILTTQDPDGTQGEHTYTLVDEDGQANINDNFYIDGDRLMLADSVTETASGIVYVMSTDSAGATRTDSFFVRITSTATLVITGDTNTDSDADDGSYNGRIKEGASVGDLVDITVEATNSNNPSAAITYTLVDNEASDYFTINETTGVVTVAQAGVFDVDVTRTHTIIVKASSGDSAVSQTFDIAVVPDTLEAQDDTGETTESSAEAITGNVFDNDPASQELSGPLTVSQVNTDGSLVGVAVDGTNGGSFIVDAEGNWQFEPDGDFEALATGESETTEVTLTLVNDLGDTTTTTLTITVTGESDAPIDIAMDNTEYDIADETGRVSGLTATDVDTDAEGLTYSLPADQEDNAEFKIVDDALYVADGVSLEPNATYRVVISVTDGEGSYQETFVLTTIDTETPYITGDGDATADNEVAGIDGEVEEGYYDSPVTVGITAETDHGEAVQFSLVDTDALPNANDLFVIDADTGVISVKAGATIDAETMDTFAITVQVEDGQGDNSTEVFNIAVVNTAPTAEDDSESLVLTIDEQASGNVLSNDTDAATDTPETSLTVSAVDGDENALATPVAGDNGGTFTINADGTWSFDPGSDFDSLLPGEIVETRITITVSDTPLAGDTLSDTSDIIVTVKAPADISLSENRHDLADDENLMGDLSTEAESWSEPLTYTLVAGEGDTDNASFSISGTELLVSDSPEPTPGDYTVRIRVTDANGETTEEAMSLIIVDTRLPFSLRDDNSVGDDATYNGTVVEAATAGTEVGITAAPDQDRSTMSYSLVDDADGKFVIDADTGVVTVADGAVLNAESGGYEQTITIKADDADTNQTDTKSFVIRISNIAMTVADDTDATVENPANNISGNVFDNDSDPASTLPSDDVAVIRVGDSGSVGSAVAGSNGGLFTLQADGTWVFDTNGDFEALNEGETTTSSITITFAEQNNGEATVELQTTLTITITGENDAPVLTSTTQPSFSSELEAEFSFQLDPAKVTDVDDGHEHANRTYTIAGANGTTLPSWISLNTATLTLEGTAEEAGTYLVEVTAADPESASVSYVVEVTVEAADTPTDDATPPSDNANPPAVNRPTDNAETQRQRVGGPEVIDGPQIDPLEPIDPVIPEPELAGDDATPPEQTPAAPTFDPAPFGPAAAGDDQALVFRSPERELLPDGQFIEILPSDRATNEFQLIVGLGLEDQLTTVGQSFIYQISQAAFVFTSDGEQFVGEVSYSATQINGGALPAWLSFNREEAIFTGVPDELEDTVIEIRVTAESNDGQRATAIFQILVNDQNDAKILDVELEQQEIANFFSEMPEMELSEQAVLVEQVESDEQLQAKPSLQQQLEQHAIKKASESEQQLLAQLAQLATEPTPAS